MSVGRKPWLVCGVCGVLHLMCNACVPARLPLYPPCAALSSFTTTTSLAIASRAPATVLVEVDMPWQLLTAHDNGVVQVRAGAQWDVCDPMHCVCVLFSCLPAAS